MNLEKSDIIFTNENCVGCNRCIAGCPILGACVVVTKNGKTRVEVNSEKCINCGYCLNICKHNAREYVDDATGFFEDLKQKKEISLIVSPAFYMTFPKNQKKVFGYLKSLGVKNIYNESFGVDISVWGYLKYIDENPNKSFILQPCPAFVSGIKKSNPKMLPYLAPVQSPLMCMAQYLRKYQNYSGELAYLSPCIAKKTEIDSLDTKNLVQYNITFNHLQKYLAKIDIESFPEVEPDIGDSSINAIYPFPGGLKECLGRYLPRDKFIFKFGDLVRNYESKKDFDSLFSESKVPLIIDTYHCESGCIKGTGVCKHKNILQNSISYYNSIKKKFNQYKNPKENKESLYEKFKNLNFEDFKIEYTDIFQQTFEVPKSILNEIFESMYKFTPASREVNCKACGYASCKDMAKAIALGYNTIKNCVRYERDENTLLYTTERVSGLPNRVIFMKDLDTLLKQDDKQDFSVIQFNIKNFTIINSRYGFEGGNKVISQYVSNIKSFIHEGDKLYHSYGDSFFAIVKKERLVAFLYILNSVELEGLKPNEDEAMDLRIRAGIYELTGEESGPNEIVERVSAAYLITRTQKNQDIAYFDKELSNRIITTLKLSRYVVKSIENKELLVVYQPKVRIKDNTLVGAEALIRWEKDGRKYPPSEFIPICETNGFIRRIDFFMLNSVCKQLKTWIDQGIEPVKISINFSKLHFEKDDVALRIIHIIDKWEIPHNLIEIEFTETVYTDKEEKLKETLSILKRENISTSIDDFGSGYSSLNLLQNLDFDIIKLDKSLIDTIKGKEKSLKVVKNIVRMAKDLNMCVLAEGVESKKDYDILRDLECDLIQGFLFDKPLSPKEFEDRLKKKKYCFF